MDQTLPPTQSQTNANALGPISRPDVVTRLFMRVVALAERMNRRFSRVGNPPVYDVATFPWIGALQGHTAAIRTELLAILRRQSELPDFHDISTDVRGISHDQHWKTFFLTGYGQSSARNIAACPATWNAVKNIPGLKTAMFSVMEPGTHLPPHCGPYNGLLRLHLGLLVPGPADKLGIWVAGETHRWREGKVLVFDDAYEHEAWNHTDATRVVLFLDFVKPLRFPANLLNWLLLNLAPFTPFIREGAANHAAWEERFYKSAPRA